MFSALPPTVIYIPLTATHPQSGIEHTAGAFCSPKHIPPGGRRARERDRQMAGLDRRRANSTNEPAPLPTSRGGGLWHLSPRSPTPSCPYLLAPVGTSVDASRQQRSTVARRGNADGTQRWMAAAEAAGKPHQEAEDQTSLFFRSRFFS